MSVCEQEKSNVRYKLEKDMAMDRQLNPRRVNQSSTCLKNRLTNPQTSVDLRESLYFNTRTNSTLKSTFNNPIIESIVQDGETVLKNRTLVNNIYKLRENSLLNVRNINSVKYKNGLNNYIINDIHSKSTNPGYVRTAIDGRFFTR